MKRNHSLLEYTRDNNTQVSKIGPCGPSCLSVDFAKKVLCCDVNHGSSLFLCFLIFFRYSVVIHDNVVQGFNGEPDDTGLACLMCIKNLNKKQEHVHHRTAEDECA